MRKVIKILILISWAFFWILLGISAYRDAPAIRERDEAYIKPVLNFVKSFQSEHKRKPTYREFYSWERDHYSDYTSDLSQSVDSLISGMGKLQYISKPSDVIGGDEYKFKNANWNKDYGIAHWNGDFWEYYFSWSEFEKSGDRHLTDILFGLMYVDIGLLPVAFWWLTSGRKNRAAHNSALEQAGLTR